MSGINPRLKLLEDLVRDAAVRLKKSGEENRKLRLEVAHLQEENGELEAKLRRLQSLGQRHERLRGKLERIVHKLEKAA